MTLVKIRDCVAYWQRQLNLPEWSVTVRWAGGEEARDLGTCWWYTEELRAEITIKPRSNEQELTVIHELLHLVIDGHKEWEGYNEDTERAINRIAKALYNERYS